MVVMMDIRRKENMITMKMIKDDGTVVEDPGRGQDQNPILDQDLDHDLLQ